MYAAAAADDDDKTFHHCVQRLHSLTPVPRGCTSSAALHSSVSSLPLSLFLSAGESHIQFVSDQNRTFLPLFCPIFSPRNFIFSMGRSEHFSNEARGPTVASDSSHDASRWPQANVEKML